MNKKPGRVLLICIIVLAIICPLHIYHDKKKVEDIKSGAIVIQNSETPIDELHPEFAYLWLFPYGIVEVVLLSLYYVRTRDWLTAIGKVRKAGYKENNNGFGYLYIKYYFFMIVMLTCHDNIF